MSAVNIVRGSSRAFMLTDSSVYSQAGEIVGFDCKAVPVASWNGALSFRGNCYGLIAAAAIAERYASFDEFISRSAAEIEREHKRAIREGELFGQVLIELHAVGWSEKEDRPLAFTLYSDRRLNDEARLYAWTEIGDEGYVLGPSIGGPATHRLHRAGLEIGVDYDLDDFDPVQHGLPIMEAQRRQKTKPEFFEGEPFFCVGGQAWCTTVTREGTTQRVIHDWKDAAGEPIRPEPEQDVRQLPMVAPSFVPPEDAHLWLSMERAGLIDPETLFPRPGALPATAKPGAMSRQERRAHERQQRRGAKLARV